MEGAPGHQAAGIPAPFGAGSGRDYYDNSPDPVASFPGYPLESYRTYGGFDWMTATVGGLWDSLLAEGKAWWISANSDSHQIWADTSQRGPGSDSPTNGYWNDPIHTTAPQVANGDFWPGYYSRTHVGSTDFSYAAVMQACEPGGSGSITAGWSARSTSDSALATTRCRSAAYCMPVAERRSPCRSGSTRQGSPTGRSSCRHWRRST